ncbi:MAG: hypothetical protein JOY60_05700 [Burkholderiaceae bacterium]|nr:hypothetical protein [Burkholderiaceae bacterium]
MNEELRQRKSWLDGFMAYALPEGVSEGEVRQNIGILDQRLYALWRLGENLIYAWTPTQHGLSILLAPHPLLIEFVRSAPTEVESTRRADFLSKLLARQEHLSAEEFDRVSAELQLAPLHVALPYAPGVGLGLPLVAAIVERYGIRLVDDRAVILLDAVGFSLLTPLEQVVQLNSLSCSVNAAYAKLLDREININFARTTTGDGFYIWNRMRGMAANVELYQLMQFILADNALARERAVRKLAVPQLRACFHVGSHYEFHQSEGLNPTSFSYLVGQVTIELARMIDRALPGQILLGKFKTQMRDGETQVEVNSQDFVERTRAPLQKLNGLALGGSEIDEIACYLTGRRDEDGEFGINEYEIHDKHGRPYRVYNAKINIHRRDGEPIYLGLREDDLGAFKASTVSGPGMSALPL